MRPERVMYAWAVARRPGCLLMLARFLQALSASADLALFFFLLHFFFSLRFVTSHRPHVCNLLPVCLKQTPPAGASDQDP